MNILPHFGMVIFSACTDNSICFWAEQLNHVMAMGLNLIKEIPFRVVLCYVVNTTGYRTGVL